MFTATSPRPPRVPGTQDARHRDDSVFTEMTLGEGKTKELSREWPSSRQYCCRAGVRKGMASSGAQVCVDTGQATTTTLGLPQLSVWGWLQCTVLTKKDGGPGLVNFCK